MNPLTPCPLLPEKGLLPDNGALTEIDSSGIIFGARAGISGKSPAALAEYNCHRINLVIILPGEGAAVNFGEVRWGPELGGSLCLDILAVHEHFHQPQSGIA